MLFMLLDTLRLISTWKNRTTGRHLQQMCHCPSFIWIAWAQPTNKYQIVSFGHTNNSWGGSSVVVIVAKRTSKYNTTFHFVCHSSAGSLMNWFFIVRNAKYHKLPPFYFFNEDFKFLCSSGTHREPYIFTPKCSHTRKCWLLIVTRFDDVVIIIEFRRNKKMQKNMFSVASSNAYDKYLDYYGQMNNNKLEYNLINN